MKGLRVVLALCGVGFAVPGSAVVEHPVRLTDPRWLDPSTASDTVTAVQPGVTTPAARAALEFAERYGGEWSFRGDVRSGKLALAMGSGIPLAGGKSRSFAPLELDQVEPRVRAFIQSNAEWLSPRAGTLVYDADRSVARREGELISLRYAWSIDGIPVEDAGVFVGINHGNITRVAARFVGDLPELTTTPKIDAAAARRIALTYTGDPEYARIEEPQLVVQPEDTLDGRRTHRLVWKMRHVARGRIETWETRIDAATGIVVGFRDVNMYGRAVGGVYPDTVAHADEIRVPFPGLTVQVDGTPLVTDSAGRFSYTGGTAITRLDGRLFDTDCYQCTNPEQPFARKRLGTGRLDLGVAGHDQTGNGFSSAADRNTFYHLNQARRIAAGWLPDLPWLGGLGFPSNVNLPLECNAFFDGASVNFFRSGGNCNNSGLIRDVIQHEWGHGLDSATLFSDASTGEGTADVAAMHLGHSPIFGPGFFMDGSPLRILDASISPLGTLTHQRVAMGACERPMGGISFHCVGQLYGQAAWELAQMLIARHGHHTGWRVSERLFFASLPDAGSMFPDTTMSVYEAYLQADDDDGNLANGTPHAAEIHAAFATHQIAGEALPVTEHCVRPRQPTVTVEAGCRRFDVSWNDVEGAARYRVLRSEIRQDSAFFPIARVPAGRTGFVDSQVAPGFDYSYVVLAVSDTGCESTVDNPVAARLPAQPELSVSAVTVTDTARGNRSGFADPQEQVDLEILVSNYGDAEARAVTGTVRSLTPGIELAGGGARWPTIPAGEARKAERPLRISIGGGVRCGDLLSLKLVPEETSACAGEASYFPVRIGKVVSRGEYVCDLAPACFTAPTFAGLENAVAGSSCGETRLTWQAATSHCVDATVTYDIHRSADPSFVPGPHNLLVARHEGTVFDDAGLEPGTTYHYVVRAYDSRSAQDDNFVVHSVAAPGSPDIRPPLFGGLVSAEPGQTCGEVQLTWAAAAESCSLPLLYDIYRSDDPAFDDPGPDRWIATTESTEFVDFAPEPGRDYTYVVRARDAAGNADGNTAARTVRALILDRELVYLDFEASDGRWEVIEPNDASRGTWEWGDPEGSEIQSEDDATVYGSRAWITGLANLLDDGNNNDVDQGTTTLLSYPYDLGGTVDPVVRYMRWFTNDRFQNPGDPRDSFRVHASNDDGATWRLIEEVGAGTPLEWVGVEIPLSGILHPSGEMRFRFTAADPGTSILDSSGVEAGIDEFALLDRDQGCRDCPTQAIPVDSVRVTRSGPDLVLTWTADTAPDRRFIVERLSGRELRPLRLGTTADTTFSVVGGATGRQKHAYRVQSIGGCVPAGE